MTERTIQLSAVMVGVALIVIYSIAMISSGGASPWAWLLLFIGIGLLVAGGRMRTRGRRH